MESDVLDWVEFDKEVDEYFFVDNYDNEKYYDDVIVVISNFVDLVLYDCFILMGLCLERGNLGCYVY